MVATQLTLLVAMQSCALIAPNGSFRPDEALAVPEGPIDYPVRTKEAPAIRSVALAVNAALREGLAAEGMGNKDQALDFIARALAIFWNSRIPPMIECNQEFVHRSLNPCENLNWRAAASAAGPDSRRIAEGSKASLSKIFDDPSKECGEWRPPLEKLPCLEKLERLGSEEFTIGPFIVGGQFVHDLAVARGLDENLRRVRMEVALQKKLQDAAKARVADRLAKEVEGKKLREEALRRSGEKAQPGEQDGGELEAEEKAASPSPLRTGVYSGDLRLVDKHAGKGCTAEEDRDLTLTITGSGVVFWQGSTSLGMTCDGQNIPPTRCVHSGTATFAINGKAIILTGRPTRSRGITVSRLDRVWQCGSKRLILPPQHDLGGSCVNLGNTASNPREAEANDFLCKSSNPWTDLENGSRVVVRGDTLTLPIGWAGIKRKLVLKRIAGPEKSQ